MDTPETAISRLLATMLSPSPAKTRSISLRTVWLAPLEMRHSETAAPS